MGCCGSGDEANRQINSYIVQEEAAERRTVRVLILGTGDSGKTTLVKQMRTIYKVVTPEERSTFTTLIQEAVMAHMKTLCQMSEEWQHTRPECKIEDETNALIAAEFRSPTCPLELKPEYVSKVQTLWEDPAIQATYGYRNEYPLAENVPYFISRAPAIAEEGYLPTWDDYIRFRMRTTGHTEEEFPIQAQNNNFTLKVTDVGGQHAERKKWLNLFTESNIHGVIYVMGVNGYDACLFEDSTVNRWRDSLNLFGILAGKKMFDDRSTVLFFNKKDLFEEKIKRIPVTVSFKEEWDAREECTDPHDYHQVSRFLFSMFEEIYFEKVERTTDQIHHHMTSCLDTGLVQRLMMIIQNDLVRTRLQMTGFY